MSEWKEVRLGDYIKDIAAGPFGSNLKVSCFVDKGFPIIDGANLKSFKVTDNITKYVTEEKARSLYRSIAKRGDIIVTISGNVGQIAYIPYDSEYKEYLVSQRQFRVTIDDTSINVPFLIYYFHTRIGQSKILSFANQVGVPALSQPLKNFRNITISIPEIKEQKKIASILSSLDSKIENNRKICANLEAQAQALFKHWFIDFAPFKDGKFVESELGMIPEGWRVGKLGEIAEVSSGKRPLERFDTETEEHNVPLIGASCVMGYTNEAFMSTKILLTGRVGTLGVIQRFNNACWPSDNTLVLTTQFYEFVYQTLKTLNYSGMNRGTSQPLITQGDLKKTSIIIPPDEVINEFEDTSSKLMSILEQNNKESKILSSLRDTLLPKLMSGEIKV